MPQNAMEMMTWLLCFLAEYVRETKSQPAPNFLGLTETGGLRLVIQVEMTDNEKMMDVETIIRCSRET